MQGPILAMLAGCVLAGCSGNRQPAGGTLTGRIMQDGAPIPLDPALVEVAAAFLSVELQRFDDAGVLVFQTSVQAAPDGSFVVRGLEPGTYKIGIACFNGGTDEMFGGRLAADLSGVEIAMEGAEHSIAIDVADALKRTQKQKKRR